MTNQTTFCTVVNATHQYAVWPVDCSLPPGWRVAGCSGTQDDCFAWITENWKDAPLPRGEPPETTLGLHDRFVDQAHRRPRAVATIHRDRCLTYAELHARAEGIAAALLACGIGTDDRVGVCVERSAMLPAVLLGVLKAGAAYVALDPQHPAARLRRIAEAAVNGVIVVDETGAALLAEARVPLLALSGLSEPAPPPRRPCRTAYVMYTSGSTGVPKGVMISHDNVMTFFDDLAEAIEVGPTTTWLAISSFGFDISVVELLWPLTVGGCVVVADAESNLLDLIERHAVTHLQCTPGRAHLLLAELGSRTGLQRLKYWLVGGERLSADLANRMCVNAPDAQRFNVYGPTETTIWSTAQTLGGETCDPPPIGRPLRNTRTYVADDRSVKLLGASPGELLIGGAGVAVGYLKDPAGTAARFVPDPFGSTPGQRLYRTGDIVQLNASGELEFVGRTDDQVKIRGFRVELGEVETRLLAHPAVEQCVVTAANDALTAHCVLRPDANASATELRRHARLALPDYMVPGRIMFATALPLTPSGKVNRSALRMLSTSHTSTQPQIDARTNTETTLVSIWHMLLGVAATPDQDFFELGGHSLLIPALIDAVAARLGRVLSPRSVFAASTLQRLAAEIDRAPALAAPVSAQARSAAIRARLDAVLGKGSRGR